MSDPVTNAEVEDVLSSIRRLVSEDKRPMQHRSPEPAQDRLVLTPALRVAEEEVVEAPVAPEAQSHEQAAFEAPDETDRAHEVVDEAPRPETNISDLVTSDEPLDVYGDAPYAQPVLDMTEEPDLEMAEAPESAASSDLDVIAEDYSDDPYGFDNDDDFDGEGDEVVLTTISEQARENVGPWADTPIGAGDDDAHLTLHTPAPYTEDSLDETQAADHIEDMPKTSGPILSEPAPQEDATASKAVALSAKIAALETAIGKIADTWEPDDPGESDYAGTDADDTMEWEDEARVAEPELAPHASEENEPYAVIMPAPAAVEETDVDVAAEFFEPAAEAEEPADAVPDAIVDAPEALQQDVAPEAKTGFETADAEDDVVPPAATGLPMEEQLVDEDALRDLVSDIVRAELQGALGERITRNVRKLVRREIHRALTAQELE